MWAQGDGGVGGEGDDGLCSEGDDGGLGMRRETEHGVGARSRRR